MPRASKIQLDKFIWDKINKTFLEVISSKSEKELKVFLGDFLTQEEKVMLAKRLALYIMISAEYSDEEIKELLKISYETVRSARNLLGLKNQRFSTSLKGLVAKPKKPSENNSLINFLDAVLSAKSNMKSRAKLMSGDF